MGDNVSQLKLLQAAVDQAFNAVMITDAQPGPQGPRIVYVNPAFCQMTGYAEADLLGQTPRILQGPLTSPEVLQNLRECLAADQSLALGDTAQHPHPGGMRRIALQACCMALEGAQADVAGRDIILGLVQPRVGHLRASYTNQ